MKQYIGPEPKKPIYVKQFFDFPILYKLIAGKLLAPKNL